ncbi:MAG: phytanoyl-CoA dioxygenase family protein [Pseudomonadota bacterium]
MSETASQRLPRAETAQPLTDQQIATYHEQGFLCPLDVLSPDEAAYHRGMLERLEGTFEGQLAQPVGAYLRSSSHLATDVPLQIARDPRILDRVESLIGPDILLWGCEYFIKNARSRQIVSWHQDLTYWGMDGSDHEVTAWLALSPATSRSGCMRFVPGSHKHSLVPHSDTFAADNLLSRGQEIAVEVDEEDAVHAALAPGQMSLHHGRLFHASGPNVSDDRRIGLVMRFIRPDTPATGHNKDFAMLMRGADRFGHRLNVMPPPGDFTPAKLALYEEVRLAQTSVLADGLESADAMYRQTAEARHG